MPLNFEFTFEQGAILDLAERLGREELRALAAEAEAARGVPAPLLSVITESGLMPAIPESYGGNGTLDPVSFALATGGLATGDAAIASALVWNACSAETIVRCGTEAQKSQWLPMFTNPDFSASIAHLEGYGRAPSEYETTIDSVAPGEWRIRGLKLAVPNCKRSGLLIVVGREPATGKLRAGLVSGDTLQNAVADDADLIGLSATGMASAEIDCIIMDDALLGGVDADQDALARAIALFRLATAFLALGAADAAISYASEYANGREAFGRPVSSFQGVAFLIADARIKVDASRLEALEFANGIEHVDLRKIEEMTAQILDYACRVSGDATRDCLQVLGGSGFITDHPIERWFRAATGLAALDFDFSRDAFSPAL